MGVSVRGMDELIRDLESVPERARKKFRGVLSRGGVQIKLDWKRRWSPVGAPPHQLPHVARGIGYDTGETATRWWVQVGMHPANPQAPLAHFPEYGSLNNPPMPGGLPALLAEEPRFAKAVGDVAVELLEGR